MRAVCPSPLSWLYSMNRLLQLMEALALSQYFFTLLTEYWHFGGSYVLSTPLQLEVANKARNVLECLGKLGKKPFR